MLCLSAYLPALEAQTTLEPATHACALKRGVVPYAPLREADVIWERRVWREIDLRDPVNRPFGGSLLDPDPCNGLMGVIAHGALDEGGITVYDPGPRHADDGFRRPFSRAEVANLLIQTDEVDERRIGRFLLKEDWVFDKSRSVMEVRIIGIAPMLEVRGEDGELRGHRPLLWLYYPECRLLFARWRSAGDRNEPALSFEELIGQRRFTSTIVKVGNGAERAINGYRTRLDALLESEAIRDQVINTGFDLWNY